MILWTDERPKRPRPPKPDGFVEDRGFFPLFDRFCAVAVVLTALYFGGHIVAALLREMRQ